MENCPFKNLCKISGLDCKQEDLISYCLPLFQVRKEKFCQICGKRETCYGISSIYVCKQCLKGFNFPRMAQMAGVCPSIIEKICARF